MNNIFSEKKIKIKNKANPDNEKSSKANEYYYKVRQFLENSTHYENHYFRRDTPTRDLLTNLKRGYYNKKDGYEWNNGIYEFSSGGKRKVDYYIINNKYALLYSGNLYIKPKPNISAYYTATQFKQSGHLNNDFSKSKTKQNRCKLKSGKSMIIYDQPVILEGQTYDDMDFRKEWHFGYLEYEGNNYGDTSTFYFVGEITK